MTPFTIHTDYEGRGIIADPDSYVIGRFATAQHAHAAARNAQSAVALWFAAAADTSANHSTNGAV